VNARTRAILARGTCDADVLYVSRLADGDVRAVERRTVRSGGGVRVGS
jgi:hypothetical protein